MKQRLQHLLSGAGKIRILARGNAVPWLDLNRTFQVLIAALVVATQTAT